MVRETITKREIDAYKREILEQSVLVKLEEAASILAVSKRTVIRRVEEGMITPYNDTTSSKSMRFLASELQSYVRDMKGHLKR